MCKIFLYKGSFILFTIYPVLGIDGESRVEGILFESYPTKEQRHLGMKAEKFSLF